jgi:hypothetical protein
MVWWVFINDFIDVFLDDVMSFSVPSGTSKTAIDGQAGQIAAEVYSPIIRIRRWGPVSSTTSPQKRS